MSASTEIPKAKRKRAVRLAEGQYFFIKEYKNKSGSISYHVEGTPPPTSDNPNPERVRQNRTTLAEAQNLLNELELAAQNIETTEKILLQATRLSPHQLKKAELAFGELKSGDPDDILAAVRFWNQHNGGVNTSMSLREALELCIADKMAAGRAKCTIRAYKTAVSSFIDRYGEPNGHGIKEVLVANITRQQIKKWVESHAVRVTGLTKLRALSAVLAWCVDNGHLKTNWAVGLRLEEVSRMPKQILLLINWQSQAFLNKAAIYKDGIAMPYVVVCLLGAVRPEETPKIEIAEVNLENRFIRLHHTKTRLKRIVELSENATAMLQFYLQGRKGTFRIKNFRRIIGALKAAAGFRDEACPVSERPEGWENFPPWPHDVMRHTGLSNKLTATNDVMETTRWGGNSPQVFYEHYHGLVSSDQAAQFWSMLPDSMPRTPELMERIRLELVEWGLLKKDQPLPVAPEVPKLSYPKQKQQVKLLSIPVEELKALVWGHPLKIVAKNLGCSAVFLHRYCRHKDIPTPPRGYWTRVRAGGTTTATPSEMEPARAESQTVAWKVTKQGPSSSENFAPVAEKALVARDSETMTAADKLVTPRSLKVIIPVPIPAAPRTDKGLIDWQKISTVDLRRWVWTFPTTRIATEWGVWENTIRKQLKKRGIVPPAAGYWAKVAAGHKVPRPDFSEAV